MPRCRAASPLPASQMWRSTGLIAFSVSISGIVSVIMQWAAGTARVPGQLREHSKRILRRTSAVQFLVRAGDTLPTDAAKRSERTVLTNPSMLANQVWTTLPDPTSRRNHLFGSLTARLTTPCTSTGNPIRIDL